MVAILPIDLLKIGFLSLLKGGAIPIRFSSSSVYALISQKLL